MITDLKYTFRLFAPIVLLTFLSQCQTPTDDTNSSVKVTFTLENLSNELDTLPVFIVGSTEELGNWNPNKVELERLNDNNWQILLELHQNDTIEYKFTRGSWDNEALADNGQVQPNHTLVAGTDTTITHQVTKWIKSKVEPKIHGNYVFHRQMKGENIQARDVVVLLPYDYDSNSEKRYPVLYAHDGQNIFDPNNAFTGYDWRLDEVSDSLAKTGQIEEMIIVGIYNTSDRSAEYSDSTLGQHYSQFLVNKLKPFIDREYRTLPDRENTATMGSSMGGLISLILAWEFSETFGKAACLSPAFVYPDDSYDYTLNVSSSELKQKTSLYLDNGTIGLESKLQPGIDKMMRVLDTKNITYDWYLDEGAEHNEKAWAKRVHKPLIFLFGKN